MGSHPTMENELIDSDIIRQLTETTEAAQGLKSVCEEQKVHIDGLGQRCNNLRVQYDAAVRQINNLNEQIGSLNELLLVRNQELKKLETTLEAKVNEEDGS